MPKSSGERWVTRFLYWVARRIGNRRLAIEASDRSQYLLKAGTIPGDFSWARFAIECDTSYPGGYVALSRTQVSFGSTESALDTLQTGIDICGRNLCLITELADIYKKIGRYSEARELYTESLHTDPSNQYVILQIARTLAGERKYEESLKIIDNLTDQRVSRSEIRNLKIMIYINLEEYERAILLAEQGLRENHQDERCLYAMSFVHAKLGNIAKSSDLIDHAIMVDPDNEAYQRHRSGIMRFGESKGVFDEDSCARDS